MQSNPLTPGHRSRAQQALASLVLAGALVLAPAPAEAGGKWKFIGKVQASHSADHDTIFVQGPKDDFRKIKFTVKDAPLNLRRLVVTYDNGQPDRLDVREDIPKGGESRAIDLKGKGTRSLRKIEFWYDTKGWFQGKADVRVYGLK